MGRYKLTDEGGAKKKPKTRAQRTLHNSTHYRRTQQQANTQQQHLVQNEQQQSQLHFDQQEMDSDTDNDNNDNDSVHEIHFDDVETVPNIEYQDIEEQEGYISDEERDIDPFIRQKLIDALKPEDEAVITNEQLNSSSHHHKGG